MITCLSYRAYTGRKEVEGNDNEGEDQDSRRDREGERTEAERMEGGQGGIIEITKDEAYAIIAFIKNHEREEIPDDVWELCMRLYDEVC